MFQAGQCAVVTQQISAFKFRKSNVVMQYNKVFQFRPFIMLM